MPVDNAGEDGVHGAVVEVIDGQCVEVAQETRGHRVTASFCINTTAVKTSTLGQMDSTEVRMYPKVRNVRLSERGAEFETFQVFFL